MKRTKVFTSFLLAIMLCATALVGLAKNTTVMDVHAVDTEPPIKVGVSLPSLTDEYAANLDAAIQAILLFPDFDVVVCNANYNIDTQIAQINSFINNGADVIVVMPLDMSALTTVLTKAWEDAGTHIIVIGRDTGLFPDAVYVDFDYIGQYKNAAEDFINNYWVEGEDATALVVACNNVHGQIYHAAIHSVLNAYPEIDVIDFWVSSPADAKSQMRNWLFANDQFDVIFNCCDEVAQKVKEALIEAGYTFGTDGIPFYGFKSTCTHHYTDMAELIADLIQKLMSGEIDYSDYQQHLVEICTCIFEY